MHINSDGITKLIDILPSPSDRDLAETQKKAVEEYCQLAKREPESYSTFKKRRFFPMLIPAVLLLIIAVLFKVFYPSLIVNVLFWIVISSASVLLGLCLITNSIYGKPCINCAKNIRATPGFGWPICSYSGLPICTECLNKEIIHLISRCKVNESFAPYKRLLCWVEWYVKSQIDEILTSKAKKLAYPFEIDPNDGNYVEWPKDRRLALNQYIGRAIPDAASKRLKDIKQSRLGEYVVDECLIQDVFRNNTGVLKGKLFVSKYSILIKVLILDQPKWYCIYRWCR